MLSEQREHHRQSRPASQRKLERPVGRTLEARLEQRSRWYRVAAGFACFGIQSPLKTCGQRARPRQGRGTALRRTTWAIPPPHCCTRSGRAQSKGSRERLRKPAFCLNVPGETGLSRNQAKRFYIEARPCHMERGRIRLIGSIV